MCVLIPSNTAGFSLLLYQIANTADQHVSLGVSIFGTVFNMFSLIVLLDLNLTHNFYDFLRCRCLSNLAVCLIGIFYYIHDGWIICAAKYSHVLVSFFFLLLPMRMALLASAICDNLLILNRLANLYNKKHCIILKLSKKVMWNWWSSVRWGIIENHFFS